MNKNTITTNKISNRQVLAIRNISRSLGLSTGLTGTRLINKVVQILVIKDLEIVVLEDIYKEISTYYPNIKPVQMRKHIVYALQHRDYNKSENNFEEIFGFEYDDYYFEPKIFMEEIANVIRLEPI